MLSILSAFAIRGEKENAGERERERERERETKGKVFVWLARPTTVTAYGAVLPSIRLKLATFLT
jgi:hypothetical protein